MFGFANREKCKELQKAILCFFLDLAGKKDGIACCQDFIF